MNTHKYKSETWQCDCHAESEGLCDMCEHTYHEWYEFHYGQGLCEPVTPQHVVEWANNL